MSQNLSDSPTSISHKKDHFAQRHIGPTPEEQNQMLQDMGASVITACNGNDALLVQDDFEGKIDLLLTDIVMPELNGIEAAELMRALRPEIKVIYMSGYPSKGQMAKFDMPDNAMFLAKPVKYEILMQMMCQALGLVDTDLNDVSAKRWVKN